MDRVLARPGSTHWMHTVQSRAQLVIAPNLHLHLASNGSHIPLAGSSGDAMPAGGLGIQTPGFFSSTIERIHTRSQRIDSLQFHTRTLQTVIAAATARWQVSAGQIAAPMQAPARVERIRRKPEARSSDAPRTAPPPPDRFDDPQIRMSTRSYDAAPVAASVRAPELNIDRLADRVVNAIDRRLLAHRERHGRI